MLRKQYHFRRSDVGCLLAWDVNKLILRTKNMIAKVVKLSKITEFKEVYWYELGEAEPTCENILEHIRLIEDVDLSYPIILCNKGRLMDGMHRVCKASLLGKQEILAFRFSEYIPPDFINVEYTDLEY